MSRVSPTSAVDSRKLLVDRVAQSRYIAKSARLHDLLLYLCDRVIDDGAQEIHEQEVGHVVFGRPKDYDTAADNIVRVHASTLRKRLEQFFAGEGAGEPLIVEIPKGNYAPLFHDRPAEINTPEPALLSNPAEAVTLAPADRRVPILAALAIIFACSTAFLFFRAQISDPLTPAVRAFWGAVFHVSQKADIVLDDAALSLYQELDGRPIALSEYFDRSYLRRDTAGAIVLKRYSSYSSFGFLWQLSRTAAALKADAAVHFARDYSFRELKANRAILLGNSRSNPWIESFENHLGLRWAYESATGLYYPVDSWAPASTADRFRAIGDHPDGYFSIALLPNLGGTGDIIIVSVSGGSTAGVAGAFLMDEDRMAALRAQLHGGPGARFPHFEALLKIPSRSRLPRDAEVVVCRAPRK